MDGDRSQRQAPRARPRDRDDHEAFGGVALSEVEAGEREGIESEELPFELHVERLPTWGLVMSALTIVTAIATSLALVPSILLVIPFIASTTARRFGVAPIEASIDHEGLWLGEDLVAARADILDVWADKDDTDRRVQVAVKPDALIVVHLENPGQARRFADALRPKNPEHVFAGVRPRLIDTLYPLRFLAVVGSFVAGIGVKTPVSGLLFLLFAYGAYAYVIATQIDVAPGGLTLRKLGRERTIPWSDVTEATLTKLRPRIVRGPLFTTSPWSKHAYERAIAAAKERLADHKNEKRAD